jgi:hypothetical protein
MVASHYNQGATGNRRPRITGDSSQVFRQIHQAPHRPVRHGELFQPGASTPPRAFISRPDGPQSFLK